MKVVRAGPADDIRIIEPEVHRDHRGHFLETYREARYRREVGIEQAFVQDNLARSRLGVLRGLHYQYPYAQGKLLQVFRGAVFDVVVDIRTGSPAFGAWAGFRLAADRPRQLWVPPGFAHGYLSLKAPTQVHYKCTDVYHPESQHTLRWDDLEVGVEWPIDEAGEQAPLLSEKDSSGSSLDELRDADALPAGGR